MFYENGPPKQGAKVSKVFSPNGRSVSKGAKGTKVENYSLLNRYFLTKWQVGARGTDALGYTVCYRCPVQHGKLQVQLL